MATESQERNPYVGPRPFERQDKPLFFGRGREASELLSLIIAHRAVLLYAQSGAGKTSLINAGLMPLLEEQGFQVLPLARVQGLIPATVEPEGISNLYVFNTLMSWAEDGVDPGQLAPLSFADFLATQARPVDEAGLTVPRVVIFDQFEEMFTAYPERWRDREAFFGQVGDALDRDALLRVLFVMREDYIAELDPYAALLPEKLRTHFRLERMREGPALAAVTGPLRDTRRSFAQGVAEQLVEELMKARVETSAGKTVIVTGMFVEPVQLQVVCRSLWRDLPPEVTVITRDHLQAFGDVNQALSAFYERSIQQAAQETGVKEGDLRTWFEGRLITPAGTRSTVYRGPQETGGIANAAVDVLENLHLIRGEWRAGARWYELTHDRFIEPIQASNQEWLAERWEAEQARRQLEGKAAEWVRLGRGRGGLLDEIQLPEAERWLTILDNSELGYEEDIVAFVEASRGAVQETQKARQAARQRWRLVVALAVVILLALVAAAFAWTQRQKAEAQARVAASRRLAAQAFTQLDRQLDLALLLGLEAVRVADTVEARGSLLDGLDHNPQLTMFLGGHADIVFSVAFSPDGQILASGSRDNTIRLWDTSTVLRAGVATGQAIGQPLTGHNDWVYSVAFSPDGQTLASGSRDKTIRLWNVATGEAIGRPLTGHTADVLSVAFSPDGQRLASGSCSERDTTGNCTEGEIRLWDVATGKPIGQPLTGHADWVRSVAFSPDGNMLASGSFDKTIRLWDGVTGQAIGQPLTGHNDWVYSLAFSPDGQTLASASLDHTIRLWDMSTVLSGGVAAHQRLGQPLTGHTAAVFSVAFSPDGQTLVSGSRDRTIIVWDVVTGEPIGRPLTGHNDWVYSVAFSPDGQTVASSSRDGTIILWEVAARQRLGQSLVGHTDRVRSVAFSSDGRLLASGSDDNTVILWDVATGEPVGQPLTGHTDEVWSVAFSPDDRMLASGSGDGSIILWDTAAALSAGMPLSRRLTGHTDWVNSVAFSPDGRILASGSDDNTVILWDVASGQPMAQPLRGHTDLVNSVAFSPDGRILASGSRDGTIILWDTPTELGAGVATGELARHSLKGHTGAVFSVAFSPDGRTLASGSDDRTIILWDTPGELSAGVAMGNPIGSPLTGHTAPVFSVAFSPDGRVLASASCAERDTGGRCVAGEIRLWDAATGEAIGRRLTGHSDFVYSVAFSPDGQKLASGSRDNTIILWDVGIELWRERACRLANRNLTYGEWKQFFGDEPYRETCPNLPIHPSLIQQGRDLARAGDVEAATTIFRRALALDSNLDLDPQTEARRFAAQGLTQQGEDLASAGDMAAAIEKFQEALALDSSLDLDPETEARRFAAQGLIQEGEDLARAGDMAAAIEKFQEALALDSSLDLDPETEARRWAAQGLMRAGEDLARAGDVAAAIEKFQEALALDSSLGFDPLKKARRLAAPTLIEEGEGLARQGEVEEALAAYARAQTFDPRAVIPAGSWNVLCWFGTLWEHAADVIDACQKAVELCPGCGNIRESRGVARALTGDYIGAIEDFKYYVKWARDKQSKEMLDRRREWIQQLQAGRNPFDSATLEALRAE